ncbi:MAG: hypothetical protein Q8928_00250 [Bacteroidota bacterium]|nr:hypothetical protein [Bacteroidota bacterium]
MKKLLIHFPLKSLFVGLILFLRLMPVSAQFYDSGEDPASIRWKQINTVNFQVIFPSGSEKEANRVANTLTYIYNYVSRSLGHQPRKISIILHSHSAFSNGFVSWAPKRAEFYTTPDQGSYGQDWLDQLCVHEFRHVVQIDKLNQGITRIASLLLGQQANGAVAGLVPRWFLEGDAVNTETALTSSGRGRMASFEMEVKTLMTSHGGLPAYDKALLGSYKDYIPDYYQVGYPIVAWARKNYGTSLFDNTLDYVGQHPFLPHPFSLGNRKQTGNGNTSLYMAAYSDLKMQWNQQLAKVEETKTTTWNSRYSKNYTSYRFPQYVNETTVLALKTGIDQLKQFVLVYKDGSEKVIHTPGYYYADKLSYAAGIFTWAEEISDVRWNNRSFYCIKTCDLATGNVKLLTRHTRYFAPALSPDGSKIATVEISRNNEYSLVILNAQTGEVIQQIPSPDNKFLQLPEWTKSGNEIIIVTTQQKGKSLELYNVKTSRWKTILAPTHRDITLPSDAGDYFMFTGDYNGTNNIFAVSKSDTSLWQVTNVKFGAFDPAWSSAQNSIVCSQYTPKGYDVSSLAFDPKTWKNARKLTDLSPRLYEASAHQENFNFQDSIIPSKEYPVKRYSKLTHMFNIHSWVPMYYDYNYTSNNMSYQSITPGFTLLSQDKLNTCISSLGYSYNQGNSYLRTGVTYKGLYPVIDLSMSYGGTGTVNLQKGTTAPTAPTKLYTTAFLYVPFNLTQGAVIEGIVPGVQWTYENEMFYYPVEQNYHKGMSYISYSLKAYAYLRTSVRDLAPKWGVSLYSRYLHTPFENEQLSYIWYAQGKVYLPGIIRHHSLQLTGGYQHQDPLRYYYSSGLSYPRGYTAGVGENLTTFSADYAFPIAYPDFNIGPLFYLKRLRGGLFYDVAQERRRSYNTTLKKYEWLSGTPQSIGGSLTADFHLFRIIFPINAGVQYMYFPNERAYSTSIIFRMDLSNY